MSDFRYRIFECPIQYPGNFTLLQRSLLSLARYMLLSPQNMMMLWHGKIFRILSALWGEFPYKGSVEWSFDVCFVVLIMRKSCWTIKVVGETRRHDAQVTLTLGEVDLITREIYRFFLCDVPREGKWYILGEWFENRYADGFYDISSVILNVIIWLAKIYSECFNTTVTPEKICLDLESQLSPRILPCCTNLHEPHVVLLETWWRHDMESCPALLALCVGNPPVTGGFTSQRAWNADFAVFVDALLNKRLNKQWTCRWFKTPRRPCDVIVMICGLFYWHRLAKPSE